MPKSRFKVYKTVLQLKKDRLDYVKSHWKESEKSRSAFQNPLRRSTMVANIFEDFEPPSKKFLATPLLRIFKIGLHVRDRHIFM